MYNIDILTYPIVEKRPTLKRKEKALKILLLKSIHAKAVSFFESAFWPFTVVNGDMTKWKWNLWWCKGRVNNFLIKNKWINKKAKKQGVGIIMACCVLFFSHLVCMLLFGSGGLGMILWTLHSQSLMVGGSSFIAFFRLSCALLWPPLLAFSFSLFSPLTFGLPCNIFSINQLLNLF